MEWLKTLSILLPILVVLSGAGVYLFNWFIEPDFSNGEYYTSAWIEYGINQNTLNVEYQADLQGALIPAAGEALRRVYEKSTINDKIDGKPMVVIGWVRYKTDLLEITRIVLTKKDVDIIMHGSREERVALMNRLGEQSEFTYNKTKIMVYRDGAVSFVNRSDVDTSARAMLDEFREHHYGEV